MTFLEAVKELGRRGGKSTARKLTPAQRQASARRAAEARWARRDALAEMEQRFKQEYETAHAGVEQGCDN
jgi:hypothetical protein